MILICTYKKIVLILRAKYILKFGAKVLLFFECHKFCSCTSKKIAIL